MASAFNLTAQINLRGPSNLRPIVSQIRRQLGSIDSNINLKIDNKASKSIDIVTNRLGAMNKVLTEVRNNTISLNQSLRDLSGSLGSVQTSGNSATSGMRKTSQSVEKVSKEIKVARTEMEEFGRQSALAVRRFIAFAGPTAIIFGLTNAVTQAFKEFINFDKELVRLQQVTGRGAIGVKSLQDEITNLATGLGVSSSALLEVTTTLAQAGLTVEETRIALKALAKTELAPSFENLTKTTEGAIAAIRQFGLEAGELESALGSINAVAAAFAVESGDIIAAIQRTGGVFASASKGVSEGTDALNEFVAIFTSVRQTTRESAETIATGLRTIFTRIQRSSTIQQLKQFGVELQDVEGKFVGPFEAVRRLSEALNQLDPRDIRFSTIVEELGGFRQIGKVIPLIQQFAVAQQALGVAQRGQSSLSDAQVKAQQSLANQIAKVREQFLALIRDVGQSTVFQGFFKIVLGLTSGLISLASAFKPILPILAVFGAIKGVSAIGQFATGFFGGLKKGGGAGGAGQNIGESLSGAKEKQRAEATSKAADAIRLNTDALKSLTSAVQSLDSTIKSRGSTTLAFGGKVLGFNTGGIVPGSGKGDKVPALLEPGEVVINNKAANKYGRSNLNKMNKYTWGGKISTLSKYYKSLPSIPGYTEIENDRIADKSKFIEVTPENLTEADKKTWSSSKLARWEKFEYLLARKYRLGPPAKGTGFEFLDFPKARAESKFLKKGDTYGDPDALKGNNEATIAGKNFLFANSKGTNRKPKSLEYIDISNTPVTTYWADPNEFAKVGLKTGGKIQKFMAGSVGGIMEQTEEAIPSDLAGLIEEIEKIGGTTQLYDFVPKSEIESILKEKKVFPRPTAKQLVSSPWLTAKTPDLYGDRGKYIEPLQEVIRRARPRFNAKQSGIQAQLLRNVQAASGQGYKFGLASIYGPNGELGYSSTSNAKEIEGPDGTKYLTQIIRKSLPERYLDAIRATSQDIAGVPARAAERLQYSDIFGTGGPLAFDFDETLVKGSDIPGKNPADYSDLNKVQEALKNAELTLLGKELQRRIDQYPQLLDGLRVLTARPQSNAPYLAATLARLGLPIPESKITGVSGGLNKVDNLSELETLIDDNLDNVQSVMSGGKRAIAYSEPRQPDASSRSIQVMEGYALEEMVKSLGVNISPDDADPLRPIDYPSGLGSYARYWDMPPNIPTDTKRTNSSSALSRLFEEAERFYAANFAFGGKTDGPSFDEVRQKIIDKYPDIQFRISKRTRGFGYNLMGALKSKGGLSGDSGLNFQQPTNLKQLQEYSDKLAAKLMNPEQLAVGGLADATGAMQSLMSGLYGNRAAEQASKPQKNFGKVALRDSGSRIQATYIKEGQAGQDRSGQVIADKVNGSLYAVQSSAATKGYGPKLYDIVMEAATAAGGMLTSDRRTVSDAAKSVWVYYFKNRSDVKKTPLDPENWVSNSRLLDEKLYGPPETWPPSTDPAWILQTGYSKGPDLINSPDVVRVDPVQKAIANNEPYLPDTLSRGGFASGGSVPAMVSNGEAFVPPQVAKKIGYANLDRMNQADRNGMGKYAGGGGISVFKGPGSGTSDSIGPIGLPQGSYVIRQKATKALGLNKGGGVGVRKFGVGSPGGVFLDRSASETIETALQLEAKRLGISISDLAKELKKTADETRKAALAAGKTKAEANKAAREAAGQKIDLTTLYQSDFGFLEQQIQSRPEKQTRVKAAARDNISGGDILETGQEQRKRIKEEYLATGDVSYAKTGFQKLGNKRPTGRGFTRQEAYDAGALRPDYQASGPGRGGTSTQVKLDLQTEALLAPVRQEIIQRYAKIYDEEKKAINDFYQQKVNKALAAGEEITPIVNEAKAVLAETKAKLTSTAQLEVGGAMASATQTVSAASTQRMEQLKETRARAADPFYDAKKAADAFTAGGPGGGPRVNEQIRKEQQDFFAYKAEQAGQTVGGFRQNLTKQVGAQAYAIGQERQFAKTEAKNIFAGRARELKGVDFAKATAAGATGEEASKVQGIIEEFAASLRKVDPTLGLGEARQAATKLAEGLAKGDQSVAQVIAGNKKLQEVFNKTLSETENLDEAFRRVAEAAGLSEESLKAEISPQKIKEQQFISSKEGQRFGALAEFAPGLTERFSKTRIGRGLGAGADFISGKGGRLSKAFAGAGGFTGIGTGVAVGAEALKQFLPKSVTSDPNTAGALGALSGAGSGAAMGAQLGSFAGPIGTLIGGVGGAIIGGIQGFFSAKNQAILTNALENVAKTTGDLDQAFKKLEADSSKVNFEGAQKAFGDVLAAGQPIEELAFAKTGFENLGSTLTGGVDKLSTGLAEGDVGKVVLGGLQTAFGASGLGFITDYFSAPSEAQRTEAVGAMVGSGAQRNESAARLAESGLKFKSTEELGKIFDNIKTGTGELNPITEQYVQGALQAAEAANGVKQLTAAQTQQITAQAKERAALDAYMKKRKESGATDEQIAKEISSNRAAAKKEGEEAIKVQGELAAKQALLARATKEVAIATESLLDVYRRINAEAERYSSELDQFGADIDALVGGLGGDTSMRAVNRQNEQVLGNVSAYSMEEVRAAANATAGLLGGTPDAQNLANQAVGQKLVQDQIPALLRTAGKDTKAQDDALGSIENLLSSQGLDSDAIKTVLADLKNELAKGEGLSEAELQDTIQKSFSTVGKGLEALQNVTKKYNDTLQQARKFQADYNKAVLEAGSYLRKATQVRLNAELDLAKALGRSPTLEELNKPFDVEVASLTGRLVESGDLAAGAASDPMAIAAAISSAERRKQEIEQGAPELLGAAANIPGGPAGDPLRQELNQAQLDNIRAIGDLTIASAEGRQALEKLANDGTKAANALAKIQEEQQALEGFAAFAQNVFTAEPQQLAQMELQATALNAAQASGPEFMQSRYNRQQAFAGLEQEKQFLTPQEYRDAQADLIRKSFEGQINPQTGQRTKGTDVVRKIGGKEFTLDQFIERIRGGVDQTDPNVVAFREASEVQAKANEALGKLNMEQAFIIQDAMNRLGFFLSTEFPDILTTAVIKAKEDAQTKPEVKPETKPRGPSTAESNVTRGEGLVKSGKERLAAANAEFEALPWYERGQENVSRINKQRMEAQRDIETGTALVSTNKPIAEKDKAARAMEASLEATRRSFEEAENKAKQTEENKAKAEEAIDKAREAREGGRPVMVGSGGQTVTAAYTGSYTPRTPEERRAQADQDTEARFSGTRPPIQAPPAPGTGAQQATAQAVTPTADPIAQAIRQAQAAEASGAIERLGTSQTSKEKDIAKLEARAKAERIAAKAAGTYTGPTKSEAALASAQQDLASINEQITAEKQRLAALAEQARLEAQGTQPTTGVVTTPPTGTPIPLGGMTSTVEPAQSAYDNRNPQNPNALLPRTAPVPVTMPQQASYTNQQAVSTTGERVEDKKMAREAQAITIDSASLESLNAFNTTFGSYVDKLVTFEFPTIPDVIEMKGNHVVDVRISGAAAFEGLKKDFEKMMQAEIKKAMGKIWDKTGGAMGASPNS